MSELSAFTADQLARGFRDGDFTPVEATRSVLDTIAARDGALNAFVLVDPETALASAQLATDRWRRGEPLSNLDGVPTSIKDILLTKGWPTLRGSHLVDETAEWTQDAPCVARLREAGAVLIGKTATPEFGWKGVTDSPRFGSTGNPHAHSLTAGGSSGGSAAAVGAGMGPLSVGTDGGGSLRIPAALTGTVALKPTFGLVPTFPASPFGTLSHAGPLARSVRDAAHMMDVLCGFDSRDWAAMPTPTQGFVQSLESGVAGLKIALSLNLGYVENYPEVEAAVAAAAQVFEDLGAELELADPGFSDPIDAFQVLWYAGAAKVLEAYQPNLLPQVDPGLLAGVAAHANITASEFIDATNARVDLGVRMGAFHEKYDLLLTPTLPVTAFERGQNAPPSWHAETWTSWTPYTYPFNMTMQPAASVPCGFTGDGLPIGLQIVGSRHADRLVLRAAFAYEEAVRRGTHPAVGLSQARDA